MGGVRVHDADRYTELLLAADYTPQLPPLSGAPRRGGAAPAAKPWSPASTAAAASAAPGPGPCGVPRLCVNPAVAAERRQLRLEMQQDQIDKVRRERDQAQRRAGRERRRREEARFAKQQAAFAAEQGGYVAAVAEEVAYADFRALRRKRLLHREWQQNVAGPIRAAIRAAVDADAEGSHQRRRRQFSEFLARGREADIFLDQPRDGYDPLRSASENTISVCSPRSDPTHLQLQPLDAFPPVGDGCDRPPEQLGAQPRPDLLDIRLWSHVEATPHGRYSDGCSPARAVGDYSPPRAAAPAVPGVNHYARPLAPLLLRPRLHDELHAGGGSCRRPVPPHRPPPPPREGGRQHNCPPPVILGQDHIGAPPPEHHYERVQGKKRYGQKR